jgi:hypothetical protein
MVIVIAMSFFSFRMRRLGKWSSISDGARQGGDHGGVYFLFSFEESGIWIFARISGIRDSCWSIFGVFWHLGEPRLGGETFPEVRGSLGDQNSGLRLSRSGGKRFQARGSRLGLQARAGGFGNSGGWRLELGSWSVEAGTSRLEAGGSKVEAGR